MVAGGTGLAPLRSIVEQVDQEWQQRGAGPRVHLFHGARVPWNLYDRALLSGLAAARAWFDYTEVVSDDPSFPGHRGPVGKVAAGHSWHGRAAMVCGGPQMVEHTVGQLAAAGIPAHDIRHEQFHNVGAGESDDVLSRSGEQR
jgi:NAD(P)H-flavin reductase